MSSPIKFEWKREVWPIAILVLSLLTSAYLYMHLPDQVVSHWNFEGVPDQMSGKFSTSWGLSGLLAFMYLLFFFLPSLDPKKERYQEFAPFYLKFRTAILLVLFTVQIAAGLFNLGYPIKINLVVPAVIGALFIFLGNYMGKIKQNWFVGVRTPWTMSSEDVWNKTSRMSGRAFVIFGLVLIVDPLLPKQFGITLLLAGVTFLVFGTFIYSYVLYRKEQKNKLSKPLE